MCSYHSLRIFIINATTHYHHHHHHHCHKQRERKARNGAAEWSCQPCRWVSWSYLLCLIHLVIYGDRSEQRYGRLIWMTFISLGVPNRPISFLQYFVNICTFLSIWYLWIFGKVCATILNKKERKPSTRENRFIRIYLENFLEAKFSSSQLNRAKYSLKFVLLSDESSSNSILSNREKREDFALCWNAASPWESSIRTLYFSAKWMHRCECGFIELKYKH